MNINVKIIKEAIESLAKDIEELNESVKKAGESSTRLAKALNRLTLWGVLVAGAGVILALIKFLYENQIWPFIQ